MINLLSAAPYEFFKAATILLGALSIPLSTWCGFCWAQSRYRRALVLLCCQVGLSTLDLLAWYRSMELMP